MALLNINILTRKDIELFLSSMHTITSEMLEDAKKISKKKFLEKYGHLRPGTYDIESTRYDKIKNFKIEKRSDINKKKKFYLNRKKKIQIEKLIKKYNFNLNSSNDLFEYIRTAIVSREYAKFVFTNSISLILEIIALMVKN